MEVHFTPEQVATIIVVLLLVVKGIVGEIVKRKGPERGCLYGDAAHDDLKAALAKVSKEHETFHETLLWIKTYLEVKK